MKFIKIEFENGNYELINLSGIQSVSFIGNEMMIEITNTNTYCFSSQKEARNYIKNFDEVKELLLKLSEN
ncbi:hypothetical protein [Fusobacterium pseudoperiodonticum]|uniref:hypothetical protein n=1 Tax=Fusobacterium pseudoperiodonticum TaxID=2663009 RepID=UPI0028D489B3|nr:hypothetical protein [Fusobacterium pseudoperiodonticum]